MFVFFLPSECLVVFYRYLLCAAAIPISFSGHNLMLDSGQVCVTERNKRNMC